MPFGIYGYLAAAVLALATVGGIYNTGYNAAWRKSEIASVRAKLAIALADIKAAKDAEAVAITQVAAMDAAATANQKRLKELSDDLLKVPAGGGSCTLGSYARRLRDIR